MPYGKGFGMGRGRGFGRGSGFRGYSPPWPYVGRGRGGLTRGWAYNRTPGSMPYAPYGGYAYQWAYPPYGMRMGYRYGYPY